MSTAAARLLVPLAAAFLAGCGGETGARASDIRGGETMLLRIQFDPTPAYAREDIRYRVYVQDRESGQPI